ncbi:MAG: transposase, partial [Bryobacterales bacterium]|nr:transposase [Bryobacterales bacterium]
GARLCYLPPYSPDYNPIERCWAQVKQALRATKARTVADLEVALTAALKTVLTSHISAYFRGCGYAA